MSWPMGLFSALSLPHHIDFGLRDYGTAQWNGGDPECDHRGRGRSVGNNAGVRGANASEAERKRWARNKPQQDGNQYETVPCGGSCSLCGAVRVDNQIGLEPTLADYLATMVDVFREVRRVLRDDGVCFLNIGDSYSGKPVGSFNGGSTLLAGRNLTGHATSGPDKSNVGLGIKPKDLMMVPARLAISLCDDGWYLRSDIIWHKRAPMPESVTDRPTSAHEHIFLLTKSARYFYDADAVRETPSEYSTPQTKRELLPSAVAGIVTRDGKQNGPGNRLGNGSAMNANGPNLRNVWTLSPEPYPDAHFATFPTEIPRRCIKAGSRPGDTILDPFGGSGTTALVADELGRDSILIELNPSYAQMARDRVYGAAPMFASVEVA